MTKTCTECHRSSGLTRISDPTATGGTDKLTASRWSALIAADEMACHDVTLPGVAANLALDEAMLIEADEGRGPPLVRFWEPADYAVVLGASRRIRDDVVVDACRADGVPIFRRSSGGGTVLIGPGTLNVTVILPETAGPGLTAVDAAQRHVLERLAEAIRGLGPPVDVLGHGDLVLGDRKCGGSASGGSSGGSSSISRSSTGSRSIGSPGISTIPARQPAYRRGRPHHEFLCNLDLPRPALVEALRPGSAPCPGPAPTTTFRGPMEILPSLLAERFANPDWIERL